MYTCCHVVTFKKEEKIQENCRTQKKKEEKKNIDNKKKKVKVKETKESKKWD